MIVKYTKEDSMDKISPESLKISGEIVLEMLHDLGLFVKNYHNKALKYLFLRMTLATLDQSIYIDMNIPNNRGRYG